MGHDILVLTPAAGGVPAYLEALRGAGYSLRVTEDLLLAQEVTKLPPQRRPGLLLMEVEASEIGSRIGFCRWLSAQAPWLPIVVLSARASTRAGALLAGAEAVLPTPVAHADLLLEIRRLLPPPTTAGRRRAS